MTDRLTILNDALALLGEEGAQDINTATMGTNAKKVYGRLAEAKKTVLERHGWVDALAYASIEVTPNLSNWKYGAGYLLPEDAIRVWQVDLSEGVAWQEGTVMVAPGSTRRLVWAPGDMTLNLSYVRDAPCEALGPTLAKAVSYELAAMTCWAVTGDAGWAARLAEMARVRRLDAAGVDSLREGGQDVEIPDPAWAARAAAF